jgi:hypothetical protein
MKLSAGQQAAVDAVDTHNIIVNAVAGSGKTTTSLQIARKFEHPLLLTYNRALADETATRADDLGISLHSRTYHGCCGKLFGAVCYTDSIIHDTLMTGLLPDNVYDLIIMDECQDMNQVFHMLCRAVIRGARTPPRLVVLGDRNQAIYGAIGADYRFLDRADELYCDINKAYKSDTWRRIEMNESFRVPKAVAGFINNVCLRNTRIISNRPGPRPRLLLCERYGEEAPEGSPVAFTKGKDASKGFVNRKCSSVHGDVDKCVCENRRCRENLVIIRELRWYLTRYEAEDIFILAHTRRTQFCDLRRLANYISDRDNDLPPVYLPSDGQSFNEDAARGKIVLSSYHASKGRERKVVILLGFDTTMRDAHTMRVCPNALYVALTRCKEELTIIQSASTLPFLGDPYKYADVIVYNDVTFNTTPRGYNRAKQVTKMISFNHLDDILKVRSMFYIQRHPLDDGRRWMSLPVVPQRYCGKKIHEEVADFNGTAVNIYLDMEDEDHRNRYLATSSCLGADPKTEMYRFMKGVVVYSACRDGAWYRYNQISNFNWFSSDRFMDIVRFSREWLPKKGKWEKKCKRKITVGGEPYTIVGYADYVANGRVYELKCTSSITDVHLMQVIMYTWLLGLSSCVIFNPIINEAWLIEAPRETFRAAARCIVQAYFNNKTTPSDAEFMRAQMEARQRYP